MVQMRRMKEMQEMRRGRRRSNQQKQRKYECQLVCGLVKSNEGRQCGCVLARKSCDVTRLLVSCEVAQPGQVPAQEKVIESTL